MSFEKFDLEKMMRTKMLTESFKSIQNFNESMFVRTGNEKFIGTADIMRMIRQAYHKKL